MEHFTGALTKYAQFTGRATRTEYWMFVLFYSIFYIILTCLTTAMSFTSDALAIAGGALIIIYSLALLIPSLSLSVRRLHDTGHSGALILLGLIPLVGSIILLIWFCTDSQPGDNLYGPNPKTGPVS